MNAIALRRYFGAFCHATDPWRDKNKAINIANHKGIIEYRNITRFMVKYHNFLTINNKGVVMNIEKGITRIGTVIGVILGCYFTLILLACFTHDGTFDYFEDKYKKKYYLGTFWPEEDTEFLHGEEIYRENSPSKFLYVYLPNVGIGLLAVVAPFLLGFYGTKGVTGTLNWVIRGFREKQ